MTFKPFGGEKNFERRKRNEQKLTIDNKHLIEFKFYSTQKNCNVL